MTETVHEYPGLLNKPIEEWSVPLLDAAKRENPKEVAACAAQALNPHAEVSSYISDWKNFANISAVLLWMVQELWCNLGPQSGLFVIETAERFKHHRLDIRCYRFDTPIAESGAASRT